MKIVYTLKCAVQKARCTKKRPLGVNKFLKGALMMSNADIQKISTTILSLSLFLPLFPLFFAPTAARLLAPIKLLHWGNSPLANRRNSLRQDLGQGIGQRLWLRHDV
jgi:hypothetical protein